MYAYRTPGVYYEWLDAATGIRALRTDIAGFVGIAERGPLHDPVRIESWPQFVATFGSHLHQAYLAYAVKGFFDNGGTTCWIVRVADPQRAAPAWVDLTGEDGCPALRLTASSPGVWGDKIRVSIAISGQTQFALTIGMAEGERELWPNLTLDASDSRYAPKLLNDGMSGSRLVTVEVYGSSEPDLDVPRNLREINESLSFGADGLATLRPEHFIGGQTPGSAHWGLAALEAIDEVGIVAMPDIQPKTRVTPVSEPSQPDCVTLGADSLTPPYPEIPAEYAPDFTPEEIRFLQQALITHCNRLKDRFALLDSPPGPLSPTQMLREREQLAAGRTPSSRYAALYYPWVRVTDPDPLGPRGSVLDVPPSGHVAGLYARTDLAVGVHKPPANEPLEAVEDVAKAIDDIDHGRLNERGVNVIRTYPGRGIRVSGARTLNEESEWRYVNVRRLLIMIAEAIDEQTQWTVFEPNNPSLWRDLERTVRVFLRGLWRRGMLDGAAEQDAFFVRCDDTTNPPEETDNGRCICLVGVQPPWPAEFVVVRIGKTESGTELLEIEGGNDG